MQDDGNGGNIEMEETQDHGDKHGEVTGQCGWWMWTESETWEDGDRIVTDTRYCG